MVSIELKDVYVRYPNLSRGIDFLRPKHNDYALSGISIHLSAGDRLGVIGANGAGKSTLIRVMADIYPPNFGTVKVRGSIAALLNLQLGMDPLATGFENIQTVGLIHGLKKCEINALIPYIIAFSGLESFMDKQVRTYSAGMKMRLAFSIVSQVNPEILIMDEWISTGDKNFILKAQQRLVDMVANSKLVILASHNMQLIRDICNKVVLLEKSKIRYFGDAEKGISTYFRSI